MTVAKKEEHPSSKKRHGQMTAAKWAEAEALWESGDVILNDLVAKFGRSRSAFQRHFALHGIKQGSKAGEHKKAVAKATTEAACGDAMVLATRIRETKEEHYKMATGLAKLTWNEVLQAKTAGLPMASIQNNVKALDQAMAVLVKARSERFAVLGLDRADFVDEESMPELVISELTADQVEALQSRTLAVYGEEELTELAPASEDDEIVGA